MINDTRSVSSAPCRKVFWAVVLGVVFAWGGASAAGLEVRRFAENPIIVPEMLNDEHPNVNGPSLIRAPEWLPNRLGEYYLYFAHHNGTYIRLAYADRLEGPWTIYEPGTITIEDVEAVNNTGFMRKSHVASPDIYIDHENRKIRMYFHFHLPFNPQVMRHRTTVAESDDGITNWKIRPGSFARPYVRHFRYGGWFYFVDREGLLLRSRDGLTEFEVGPDADDRNEFRRLKQDDEIDHDDLGLGADAVHRATYDPDTGALVRHTAVHLDADRLHVFFSRVGDTPETIYMTTLSLNDDWLSWEGTEPCLVMRPEYEYEGVHLPIRTSEGGKSAEPVHELRDPAIYEEDGRIYLLYSVQGEFGIAIAELIGL